MLNFAIRSGESGKFFIANKVSFLHYSHFHYYYKTTKEEGDDSYNNLVTLETADTPTADGLVWDFGIGFKKHHWIFQIGSSYTWIRIPLYEVQGYPKRQQVNYDKYESAAPYYLPFYFTFGYSIGFKKKEKGEKKYTERSTEKPARHKLEIPRYNGEDIK